MTASRSRFRLRRKTSRSSAPNNRNQERAGLPGGSAGPTPRSGGPPPAPWGGRAPRVPDVSRRHRSPPRSGRRTGPPGWARRPRSRGPRRRPGRARRTRVPARPSPSAAEASSVPACGSARPRPANTLTAPSGSAVCTTTRAAPVWRSSGSEPWKTSRPVRITPTCVQTCSTSASRCEETNTVVPSAAICRTRARTSRVPCGSSPLVGSSRMISSRGRSRLAAMASRCFMPSE